MRRTYAPATLEKSDLLADRYCLAQEGRYRVYFAPLGAWPPEGARLVLLGLTPGETQTREAAKQYLESPKGLRDDADSFGRLLRSRVAFKGSMRRNLCSMLDEIGVPERYGVPRSADLFDDERSDVAATSALIYPVFTGPELRNFSGGSVDLADIPLFRRMLDELLSPRLDRARDAIIIPLGKAAATGLRYLCEQGKVGRKRILAGMPHPSGANGHRIRQFAEQRKALRAMLARMA
jgi:hypothetical protein